MYNALRSRYLAVGLMAAIIVASVLALLYPQADATARGQMVAWARSHPVLWTVGRALQATRVFSSWWFLTVAALLLLNGSLCLLEQIEKAVKLTRKGGFELSARMARPAVRNRISVVEMEAQAALERVAVTLRRAGLHVRKGTRKGEPALLGVGRGWSQWGAVAFHGALLLVLVSLVLVSLTWSKGSFRVVVGGEFKDRPDTYGQFSRGPYGSDSLGGWTLRLAQFRPRFRKGAFKIGPASDVRVEFIDGNAKSITLTRGEALDLGAAKLYQSPSWGFAPVLTVRDPSGRKRKGAAILRSKGHARPSSNFDVGMGLQGSVQLARNVRDTTVKPKLRVRLRRGSQEILSGYLTSERSLNRRGYAVTYTDFRYWSELTAVRSPWLALTNAAFWLLVAGLTIMYVWPSTYAWALVRKEDSANMMYLGGRRERFSKDFARLVTRVRTDLAHAEQNEVPDG